ncbi:MAG: hypothetical protein HYW26_01550 [Candidatus Aenigmarchaeota archaeon]|nr:hypothetical protein [Candidatus Aenigmarchaeota archaeon]
MSDLTATLEPPYRMKEPEKKIEAKFPYETVIGGKTVTVVGGTVLGEHGGYRRVRLYIRGWHDIDSLAVMHKGHTGEETVIERYVLVPVLTVNVLPVLPVECPVIGKLYEPAGRR